MSYAQVSTSVTAAGANTFSTASRNYSGASLLVAAVSANTIGGATLSDSLGNTWQTDGPSQTAVNPNVKIYYAKNPTVSAGQTFTLTGSSIFATLNVSAWSGADTSAPLDQQNGTGGAGFVNTAPPGSITPSVNDCLVISLFGWSAAMTINTVTGCTILNQTDFAGGTNYGGGHAFVIQTTAAAINAAWNFTGSVAGDIVVASFKPSVGGGGDLSAHIGEPICGSSLLSA